MRKVEIRILEGHPDEMYFNIELLTDDASAKEGPSTMRMIVTKHISSMQPSTGFKHLPHFSEREMQHITSHTRFCFDLFSAEKELAVLWLNNLD
jgi:hypothetical protein